MNSDAHIVADEAARSHAPLMANAMASLDVFDRRRLARRQRLQDAIESLKQMRESRGALGESEFGSLPPAA